MSDDVTPLVRRPRSTQSLGTNALVAFCVLFFLVVVIVVPLVLIFAVFNNNNGNGGTPPTPTPPPPPPADLTQCGSFLELNAAQQQQQSDCGGEIIGECVDINTCGFTVFNSISSVENAPAIFDSCITQGNECDSETDIGDACFCPPQAVATPVCTRLALLPSEPAETIENLICREPTVCGLILDVSQELQLPVLVDCEDVGTPFDGVCENTICMVQVRRGLRTQDQQEIIDLPCTPLGSCAADGDDCECLLQACTRQLDSSIADSEVDEFECVPESEVPPLERRI